MTNHIGDYHFGRRWSGTEIEDECPCHKAPCGLVDDISSDCQQHGLQFSRTMRQVHPASTCPALKVPERPFQ